MPLGCLEVVSSAWKDKLTDLLAPHGEKWGQFYTAGPVVLQARQRVVDQLDVPVTEPYPNFRARLAMDVT